MRQPVVSALVVDIRCSLPASAGASVCSYVYTTLSTAVHLERGDHRDEARRRAHGRTRAAGPTVLYPHTRIPVVRPSPCLRRLREYPLGRLGQRSLVRVVTSHRLCRLFEFGIVPCTLQAAPLAWGRRIMHEHLNRMIHNIPPRPHTTRQRPGLGHRRNPFSLTRS
eukprot:COSAG02_NODE_144_length_34086_cov_65.390944_25_plen_166_part_00